MNIILYRSMRTARTSFQLSNWNILISVLEALLAGIQVLRLEFYEMFSLFPNDYQNIMRKAKFTYDGSIVYSDCKYAVPLIGGTPYWAF